MSIQFGRTAELTNTQFAPVAALMAYYEGQGVLEPLQSVTAATPNRGDTRGSKLSEVLLSILVGCEYLAEVNTKLRPERILAQVNRKVCFCEQSTLALALNELSQMNLAQLAGAVRQISDRCSRTRQHDWRGLLRLDLIYPVYRVANRPKAVKKGILVRKKRH